MKTQTGKTREKILEVATKLLRNSGLKEMGQIQIAKAAKVSQGHLTYYFPKRSDLVLAVMERAVFSIADIAARAAESGVGELTKKKILGLVRDLLSDEARTRAMLGLLVESNDNPELLQKLRERSQRETELIALIGQRKASDPIVSLVHSALFGIAIQNYLWRGTDTDVHATESLKILSEWLTPKNPGKAGS